MDRAVNSMIVDDFDSADAAIFGNQIGRELELADRNFRKRLGFRVKRPLNFASGRVAVSVQNTVAAVRALAAKGELSAFAIELRSPCDQLFDTLRCILYQNFRSFRVA